MEAAAGTRTKTTDLVYTALCAALIAVCSWISVPAAVPFTLQTFAVFAALNLLGGKRGTTAVLVYILLGAVGLPVFSGFKGGPGVLLGTTGGYIIGFLFTGLLFIFAERLFAQLRPYRAGNGSRLVRDPLCRAGPHQARSRRPDH